jgi:hypothetical protein
MDSSQHNQLRKRIRQIIRSRAHLGSETALPEKRKGGFLPLAAIPAVASALPGLWDFGKRLFSGSGKHKAGAKTRKPNQHALKVKKIMAENPGMSLGEASKLAAAKE